MRRYYYQTSKEKFLRYTSNKSSIDDIFVVAKALDGLYNQSYTLLRPTVDDVCKHPENVTENELEHLFDAALEIMNDKGKQLFDKLCKVFASHYPECVKDYIRIAREQDGE